jgi:hypothetical protein
VVADLNPGQLLPNMWGTLVHPKILPDPETPQVSGSDPPPYLSLVLPPDFSFAEQPATVVPTVRLLPVKKFRAPPPSVECQKITKAKKPASEVGGCARVKQVRIFPTWPDDHSSPRSIGSGPKHCRCVSSPKILDTEPPPQPTGSPSPAVVHRVAEVAVLRRSEQLVVRERVLRASELSPQMRRQLGATSAADVLTIFSIFAFDS